MALLMRCWVGCERRPASRPGHVGGAELELSDLLRRKLWGKGIASRAACLLLHTAAQHDEDQDEDQPVLVVTQRSNEASLALARRLGLRRAGTCSVPSSGSACGN